MGSACPAEAFEDVDLTMWYHEAVDWALLNDAMNGYENGTFGPDDPLAREQAAGVLWNLLGNKDTSAPAATHADVDQNAWYTDAVNWAVENGYMNAYDGTDRFGIGDALTREQFACVIANAAGADLDAADSSAMSKLPDAGAVSDWAEDAMAWAVDLGVINGVETDNGRELQPGRTISRSEMAAMTMNAVTSGVLDLEGGNDPSTDPEQPEVTPADEFLYERIDSGMRIVGYVGTSGSVTIPETIEGAPVTQIDGLHVDPTSPQITELDLTAAKHLVACDLSYMNGRPEDEFTKDKPGFGTHVAIDASGLTVLEELDCTWAGAESLDITGCTALRRLVCAENYLTHLDLSSAKDLEELNCNENSLAAIDITSNPTLKTVNLSDNALTKLDTTHNAALVGIDFSFNEVAATVDLSGSPDLVSVICRGNPDVTLIIEGCTELEVLNSNLTV